MWRARTLGLLVIAATAAFAGAARAAATAPEAPDAFSLAFSGGGLFPRGAMGDTVQPGLDVDGRFGVSAQNGLGLVLNVEYAPLRQQATATPIVASLFAGNLGPRFTFGHGWLRFWIAGAGGLVVERSSGTQVTVDTAFTVNGLSGLDLHLFGNGGVTLTGAYTKGLTAARYEFVSVTGGLLFTM